jgi:hypothetical protein
MTLAENLNSEFYFKQLYKELRHLLFAVADLDGKIRKHEVDALRDFELKHLAPFLPNAHSPGLNQAFYAQFEFEVIAGKNKDAAVVSSNFQNYLKRNASNINKHFKASLFKLWIFAQA